MLEFLKKLVDFFQVGPDNIRFAAIAYSTNAKVEFTFNTLRGSNLTKAGYKNLLDSIQPQWMETYIDRALELANTGIFTTFNGMRSNVQKVQWDKNLFTYLFIYLLQMANGLFNVAVLWMFTKSPEPDAETKTRETRETGEAEKRTLEWDWDLSPRTGPELNPCYDGRYFI